MRNLILSSSKIDLNSRCKRKFNFEINQNLVPNHLAAPLEKGDMMHKMLEQFYLKRLEHKSDASFAELVTSCMNFGRHYASTHGELSTKDIELVTRVFRDYCMYNRFETITVEAVEQPFAKILYEDTDVRIIIEGTYDLLGSNGQISFVMDHKTKSQDTAPIKLTNQFQCYAWASNRRVLIVNGLLLNLEKPEEQRYQRTAFDYDPKLIEEWKEATIHYALELDRCAQKDYFPPDFTSCKMFGLCHFYSVCSQPPNMRIDEIERDFKVGLPYDSNRFKKETK